MKLAVKRSPPTILNGTGLPAPPEPIQLDGPRNTRAEGARDGVLQPCRVMCTAAPTAARPGQTVIEPAGEPLKAKFAGWLWLAQPPPGDGGVALPLGPGDAVGLWCPADAVTVGLW